MTSRVRPWRGPVPGHLPESGGDRNVARLLMLLTDAEMTIAALREGGVRSPAQGLYDLEVSGYRVERVRPSDGQDRSVRYRLNTDHGPYADG